jgi:hypothetical protein
VALPTFANTKISVESNVGYDSNPYRFNEQFNIADSSYFSYKLKAKHEIGKELEVKAQIKDQTYGSDAAYADNQTIQAEVRYQTGKKRRPSGFELSYKNFDKTYVSRLQGSTDTYQGIPLDDRYDFDEMSINGFTTLRIKKFMYNQLAMEFSSKDYGDFDQLNITDYDYQSIKLSNTLKHRIRRRVNQEIDFSYESRMFSNREQKDLTGNEIADTEMVFNYLNMGYEYQYERIKNMDLSLSANYKIREDNSTGYYNSSWFNVGLKANFKVTKASKLQLSYSYKDFSFDREPVLDINGNDDEFASDTKQEFGLKSKTRLPKVLGERAHWEIDYSYLSADSNYVKYTYDRHIIETGLKVVF